MIHRGSMRFDLRLSPSDSAVLIAICLLCSTLVAWRAMEPRFALGAECRTDPHRIAVARDWINPNTAQPASMQRLPGIGPSRAKSIVEHRNRHGAFKSPDDLREVHGIGPATVDAIAQYLRFDDE